MRRFASAAVRRLCSWPLRLSGRRARAEILESLAEQSIQAIDTPGGQIRFYAPSPLLLSRADSLLSKEPDTIKWIDGFEDGDVLWDIGANVGVFSLYAAIAKVSSVIAFEPLAANFHVLSRNVQLNRLDGRMRAYCIAFAERTQLGVLNAASPSMGASLGHFGKAGERSPYCGVESTVAQSVIGFSIDDFISQFDPPFPNHLKIDVDGLEIEILEGACATLHDSRLRSVLVELSLNRREEHDAAVRILEAAGFHFSSRGDTQESNNESAANHLFRRIPTAAAQAMTGSLECPCNAESAELRK